MAYVMMMGLVLMLASSFKDPDPNLHSQFLYLFFSPLVSDNLFGKGLIQTFTYLYLLEPLIAQ